MSATYSLPLEVIQLLRTAAEDLREYRRDQLAEQGSMARAVDPTADAIDALLAETIPAD